jgi:hypothetical protein
MKPSWVFRFLGLFIMLCMIISCEEKTEENNECDATKMSSPQNPTIYLKLGIAWDSMPTASMMNYISYHATWALFSGTITKVYCGGKVSSTFSFNPTFYPDEMDYQTLGNGFYLPQPYQFKFENDLDYVHVIARIKYFFDKDNSTFESLELSQRFYYKNLYYDYNLNSNYISLYIDDKMQYVRVVK